MESSIWKQAAKFLRDKKLNRRWLMVFACLAVIVAAGTVTALKYNGQAMTYKQKVLDCGYQVHKHTASCYDKENKLVCGQADYVVHVHNDDCYSLNGKLVCTLPEVKEHKHDSSCYKDEATLICNQAESAGHVHDDSCYTTERGDLICGTEEHQHGDSCYNENGELTCTQAEHQHSDECYAVNRVLTCTQEEGAGGHTHTDSCYKIEKVLACGKLENHTHTKSCYDENGKLICGKTVLEEHVHSDECFKVVEMTPEEIAAMSAPYETDSAEEAEDSAEESGIFFTDVDGETDAEDSSLEGSAYEDESKLDEEPEAEYHWLSDSGSDYTVTVATPEGALPENAELAVQEIARDTAEYESYYKQMVETLLKQSEAESEEELELKNPRFFDISFMVDGEEVEPTEPVVVNISYKDGNHWTEETYGIAVHFTEDGDTETIPTDASAEGYTFVGNSFSVYGVSEATSKILDALDQAFGGGSTLAADDEATKSVNFYIMMDDKWTLIESCSVKTKKIAYNPDNTEDSDERSCISADTLAAVYGAYGFKAENITSNSYLFGSGGTLGSKVYLDHEVKQDESGTFWVPTLRADDGRTALVYYLPGNIKAENITSNKDVPDQSRFYSITVNETIRKKLEGPDYVRYGSGATVVLTGAEADWECSDKKAEISSTDGQTTVTLTRVTGPVTINGKLADGEYRIVYDLNVTGTPANDSDPTVQGVAPYTTYMVAADKEYTVLQPDRGYYYTQVTISGTTKYLQRYEFAGWTLAGEVIEAGSTLTKEKLADAATDGVVTLQAKWTEVSLNKTVNFFVNLQCQVLDTEGSSVPTPGNNYTKSVASAQLNKVAPGSSHKVFQATNEQATQAIDQTLRNLATENGVSTSDSNLAKIGVSGTTNGSYTGNYKLDSFPDDEDVFKTLRAMVRNGTSLSINGHTITEDELISENYAIRWYVLKDGGGDYWHIDGILVAKVGKLAVKKVFLGDPVALSQLTGEKSDYSITLTKKSDENEKKILKLTDKNVKKEGDNIYSWVIDVPRYTEYTVKENKYKYADYVNPTQIETLAQYRIQDSGTYVDSYTGWQTYTDDGFTVMAKAYPTDVLENSYETVFLKNTYSNTNSILLYKLDEYGEPVKNVRFQVTTANPALDGTCLWIKDGIYYLSGVADASPVEGNILVTGNNGFAQICGLDDVDSPTTFLEYMPIGYQDISEIKLKISKGTVTLEGNGGGAADLDTSHADKKIYPLTVTNTSSKFDVTVEKKWESASCEVQVRLYRNGVPVSELVTLKNGSWTYTWPNMPLYYGGELANYTVREEFIGKTAYSQDADPTDGYVDYVVTYGAAEYLDETGAVATDKSQAKKLKLTVTNKAEDGALRFSKVDAYSPTVKLEGAVFDLYETDETTGEKKGDPIRNATSDANGLVEFEKLPVGTYKLVERTAPDNYQLSEAEYTVKVTARSSKVFDAEGNELTSVGNEIKPVPLPESGGPGTTIYTFGAIAIFAMCLVYGCSMRRRRERRAE